MLVKSLLSDARGKNSTISTI